LLRDNIEATETIVSEQPRSTEALTVCFTVMNVSNSFNTEARAFIAAFDRLGLEQKETWDAPDQELLRPLVFHAGWFRDQDGNPFTDFDIPQRLVIDLANDFLLWAADTSSQPRWRRLFNDRNAIRQCWDFFERYKDEDDTDD
jgi:hypothetical protein